MALILRVTLTHLLEYICEDSSYQFYDMLWKLQFIIILLTEKELCNKRL